MVKIFRDQLKAVEAERVDIEEKYSSLQVFSQSINQSLIQSIKRLNKYIISIWHDVRN